MSGYGVISEVSSSVGASCCDKLAANFLAFIQSIRLKQATLRAGIILVWCRRTDHTCVMALLSPVVREGGIWRVKIVWPNGAVHYVEKFTSEKDAVSWINAHPRLTKPVAENANR